MYRPASLIEVVCAVPVAVSMSLTSTPGMDAFCASVTCPVMVPVVVACDQAGGATIAKIARVHTTSLMMIEEMPAIRNFIPLFQLLVTWFGKPLRLPKGGGWIGGGLWDGEIGDKQY